jgi:hypothetical protein
MYEELVTDIRYCVSGDKPCGECKHIEELCCDTTLLEQAADAIEELGKLNAEITKRELKLRMNKPRWIPVTERLPEEPYGCLLIVWDSNPMGGDDFLNYLPYFAGWDGEQWNDGDGMQVPFEVVYWMPLLPLPEPPKEET